MNDPLVAHAKARGLVRLPDGRTARLHYWPTAMKQRGRARGRTAARVCLPSGAYLSVPADQLTVVAHDDTSRPHAAQHTPPERPAHA